MIQIYISIIILSNNTAHLVICEGWHFTHMWNTLAKLSAVLFQFWNQPVCNFLKLIKNKSND
jgi:hypothetical protein